MFWGNSGQRAACHVRVRYAETDAMGVVYYANYLAFFESARIEYIRAIGCSYRDMEATGVVAAVTGARLTRVVPGDGHLLMLLTAGLVAYSAFQTARGSKEFSNKNCSVKSVEELKLSDVEKSNVAVLHAAEQAKGCK